MPLLVVLAWLPAAANTIVKISADHVAFYYDRFLLEADGNVRIETSDGFSAYGEAFSMDLKLNRFLLAGNVHLKTRTGPEVTGAAISDFLDFNRIYFDPITTQPDRWTFLNNDLAHPVKGRIMPGDVFYFPSITEQPSFTGSGAVIGTRNYIRMVDAKAVVGPVTIPVGSYVVNFSPNVFFAQNSLTGANFDITDNFAGNNNSLSAVHFRYDSQNYAYLAFEQHFVGQHEYAVVSINPATKQGKYYNLLLYDKLGSRFQIQTFTQVYLNQYLFSRPYAATQTTYITATQAFNHSYLQAYSNMTNYNMIGYSAYFNNPVGAGNMSHPTQLQLTDTLFQTRLWKLPLFYQYYVGYGFSHDSVGSTQYSIQTYVNPVPGLQSFGTLCADQHFVPPATPGQPTPPPNNTNPYSGSYVCPVYTTIYNTVYGYNLFLPSVKLGNKENTFKTFYFNASLNSQRQYNSLPHVINEQTTTLSLSRQFTRDFNSYASYQIQNTGDYYREGGYQPCQPALNVLCPPSYTAFRGASTLRTDSLGLNYAPRPEFNLSVLFRHHDDFPIPVPGLFPQPMNNVLGQPIYSSYLGQPPNDITADVRTRILPHLLLDVQRTYYFNFGTQRWSPQFITQVLPL